MTLAAMLAEDRDALACDLWETYQVRDMEALPIKTLAVLSCGLRENSRIRLKMAGLMVDFDSLMIAGCFDMLHEIKYALVGGTRPKSMYKVLMGIEEKEENSEILSFDSSEEWEAERRRMLGGIENVGNRTG